MDHIRRFERHDEPVRATERSSDSSVHDDNDSDRPHALMATLSSKAPARPAALEALTTAETERVWTDLVLALVTQSAVGNAPQWTLLESDHFQRALALLRPAFQLPSGRDARELVVPKLLGAVQSDAKRFLEDAAASTTAMTVLCSADVLQGRTLALRWVGVDQDARSQVLAVTSVDANARPEELARHLGSAFEAIRRDVLAHQHRLQRQKLPFLVHFCTDSVGPVRRVRGLLLAETKTAEVRAGDRLEAAVAIPTLVGGCVMQQSLLLFHDTLETLVCVRTALEMCMEVASFVDSCEPLRRDLKLAQPLQLPSAESFHSFIVCVNQVLALKRSMLVVVSGTASGNNATAYLASSSRALRFAETVTDKSFWAGLAFTKEVFAPFACLLVLSDAGHATSGQLLACWLLLRTTVLSTSLVPETEKAAFSARFVDRVRESGDAHAVASLIVDPRVHGLGLSALGKRKARLIIADLAARLQPGVNRSRLIEQLLTFLTRTGPFDDDDDSWAMMASLPRLFWLEYIEEMPELASVALAVLSYRPHLAPLEETWRELARRCQRHSAGGAPVPGEGGESLQAALELEHVKLHFQNASISSSDGQRRTRSADASRAESLRKYRKCLARGDGDALDAAFSESSANSGGLEERSGGAELSRDASGELQQLRLWLQRLVDEQETSGSKADDAGGDAQREADGSLSRFHADWLDVSADCTQRVWACVEKFTVGSDGSR